MRMFQRICARLGFARMNLAYRERLKDERCFRVVGDLRANVFDTSPPFGSKKIEPETVLVRIGFRLETGSKHNPLRRVHHTLEDGVLHPLSMIFAQPGHPAQSASSCVVAGAYVVADKNHHGYLSPPIVKASISRRTQDRHRGPHAHDVRGVTPAHTAPVRVGCAPSGKGAQSRPAS